MMWRPPTPMKRFLRMGNDESSDFLAQLGLKAGSTAQLLVAWGFNMWSQGCHTRLLGALAYHGLQALAYHGLQAVASDAWAAQKLQPILGPICQNRFY